MKNIHEDPRQQIASFIAEQAGVGDASRALRKIQSGAIDGYQAPFARSLPTLMECPPQNLLKVFHACQERGIDPVGPGEEGALFYYHAASKREHLGALESVGRQLGQPLASNPLALDALRLCARKGIPLRALNLIDAGLPASTEISAQRDEGGGDAARDIVMAFASAPCRPKDPGLKELVERLAPHAREDRRTSKGRNALHLAANSGNWALINALCDAGFNTEAPDSKGHTALMVLRAKMKAGPMWGTEEPEGRQALKRLEALKERAALGGGVARALAEAAATEGEASTSTPKKRLRI